MVIVIFITIVVHVYCTTILVLKIIVLGYLSGFNPLQCDGVYISHDHVNWRIQIYCVYLLACTLFMEVRAILVG